MGGTVGRTVLMTTNHAPIRVTESIQKSIDKNEFGCSILIDLKTAIDTVNHSIVLLKPLVEYFKDPFMDP